jgi:MerR family copper efflux transcriptional regulator
MSDKDMNANQSIADYLSVSEAADYLGVSSSTLRNWDQSGTFPATRHPINNYRLYRKSDLEGLLERLRLGSLEPETEEEL